MKRPTALEYVQFGAIWTGLGLLVGGGVVGSLMRDDFILSLFFVAIGIFMACWLIEAWKMR